ncbi:MAG: type IV secretion system protein VirB10 [Micavibrio sp.]
MMIDHDSDNQDASTTPDQADRGIPSVAATPRSKYVIMAIFLSLATLAMGYVIIDGVKKNATASLVEPEEVTFKGPGTATAPYIEPEQLEEPALAEMAPPDAPVLDPRIAERERQMQTEALRMAREQQKRRDERLRSPQLIIDKNTGTQRGSVYAASAPAESGSLMTGEGDSNVSFANQYENQDIETARAIQIQNLGSLITQGTMIPGILETAIQSDLPGMVRAIVSENVYGHDGAYILIPKGARLIGRYRSGLVRGQTRVFVIWNRVLRQDGVSINIGSMGTDDLGRSGLAGDLDTHFFERFGSSILLSLIDAGLQIGVSSLGDQNSATVALESGSDFSKSAEIALENSIAIPPTIRVDQGKRIKVFVAKDLDFSEVAGNIPRR